MKTQSTGNFTSEDFERWLALQLALGFTVTNPEAVEKVRAAFKAGGCITTPYRVTDTATV